MRPLRVLLVHPGIREPFDLVVDGEDSLASLQALVGGLIDCVRLTCDHDAWVNDEGILLNLPVNRMGLHGPIVVARHDEEGRTTSLDEIDVQRFKVFLSRFPLSV